MGSGFRLGSKSMMILNVSQRLANANHEKMSEKTLYYQKINIELIHIYHIGTHQGLYMEEEHANNAMTGLVQSEEVD